jgi:hypothetical protein
MSAQSKDYGNDMCVLPHITLQRKQTLVGSESE